MTMKLSDYVIDFLVGEKISHIFEFVGGAITHLIDSTYGRRDIACVSVHHEQAGAFAAEAYARINGKLGVAMATSGPGALNLVTGIGSCYFDSVPCLFITGQVNTYEYKFERPVRQIGFQETDIVSVVKPLTKYAEMITDPQRIRFCMEKAVYTARNKRPGPVLLDIPLNIQRARIQPENLESFFESDEYKNIKSAAECRSGDIEKTITLITDAERPVILAGGGIRTSGAHAGFLAFVNKTGIPVVTSLMGLDSIPHDHPAFFGMIGAYGNRHSNLTLANADLLLVLGSRLDSRQTGTRPDIFARAAKKVHVEIDPHEVNARVKVDAAINCDLKTFLDSINRRLDGSEKKDISDWYKIIHQYRAGYSAAPDAGSAKINPNSFIELLSSRSAEGDIICLDVGQNQMWAGQSFRIKKEQRMLISGGMGAMGFALPAALGAAKTGAGKNIIVITGDGGIQVNIQELETIVHHRLPVKIFVMNNNCLGMVRQFQDMYFDGRHQSTVIGYSCPSFTAVAKAYGLQVFAVRSMDEAGKLIEQALLAEGPVLVEVALEKNTVVEPKLVVNKPIEDMSPPLERKELEKIMLIDLANDKDIPK